MGYVGEDSEVVRCFFDTVEGKPRLIFEFSPIIHMENIREIAMVISDTVRKKLNCMCQTIAESETKLDG